MPQKILYLIYYIIQSTSDKNPYFKRSCTSLKMLMNIFERKCLHARIVICNYKKWYTRPIKNFLKCAYSQKKFGSLCSTVMHPNMHIFVNVFDIEGSSINHVYILFGVWHPLPHHRNFKNIAYVVKWLFGKPAPLNHSPPGLCTHTLPRDIIIWWATFVVGKKSNHFNGLNLQKEAHNLLSFMLYDSDASLYSFTFN